MMVLVLVILFSLFAAGDSFSQIFKWVDDKGGVHFTDDFTKIPEKYRPKIDKIGYSEEKTDTKTEPSSKTKTREENYKDQLGRGEEYWKNLIEENKRKIKTSQEKTETSRIKYNQLTERINDSKSSVERNNLRKERDQVKQEMDQHRNEQEEARIMLEKKIPEEAELYKAKPEWIKP